MEEKRSEKSHDRQRNAKSMNNYSYELFCTLDHGAKIRCKRRAKVYPPGKWTVYIPSYKRNFRSRELLSLSLSLSLIHTLIHPIYVPWSVERRHIRLAVSLVSVLGTSNKRRESIGRTMAGNDAARPPRGMQAAWKRRSLINFTLSIKPFNISLHAIFIFIYILYIYIWTFFCFFILATSSGIVKHLCTSAKRILSLLVVSGNLNVSQRLKEFLLPRSLHRSASLLSDESNQGLIYVLRLSLRVFSIVCHRTRPIVLCLAKARSCPQKFSRKIHA